ncbi:MAG: hypothetical protein IVW54_16790 [Candidatus Binataceae bacterium]|nr:hypothetical protein [Candidatus Binataceae bacterium]
MRNVILGIAAVLLVVLVFKGTDWVIGQSAPPPAPISGHQSIDGQATACINCKVDQLSGDVKQYKIIHAKGMCPAGWTMLKGYFTESDLNRMDACSNPRTDAAYDLDYLLSGETFPVSTIVIAR